MQTTMQTTIKTTVLKLMIAISLMHTGLVQAQTQAQTQAQDATGPKRSYIPLYTSTVGIWEKEGRPLKAVFGIECLERDVSNGCIRLRSYWGQYFEGDSFYTTVQDLGPVLNKGQIGEAMKQLERIRSSVYTHGLRHERATNDSFGPLVELQGFFKGMRAKHDLAMIISRARSYIKGGRTTTAMPDAPFMPMVVQSAFSPIQDDLFDKKEQSSPSCH